MLTSEQQLQHVLRTPLATIFGMLTFLKGGPLTAEQQVYLECISKSANALLEVVNSLSTAGRKKDFFTSPKPKVLLIEDNPEVQWIYHKLLQQLDCKVEVASNGKEALRLTNNHYDLILIDISLPDISGIELAMRFRARLKHQRTRLIALTAYTDEATKRQCLLAGIEQVIHKPISLKTLTFLVGLSYINQQQIEEIEPC